MHLRELQKDKLKPALEVALVTTIRPPEYWLPIEAKWSNGEMQTPVRKVTSWQEDMSQEVIGLNPSAGKEFFSHEITRHGISNKCNIMNWLYLA